MPTYQYACPNCGNRFEIRQSFHDDPLTECPQCHGVIHRVISPVSIIFKGPGFYVTDNKNGNHKNGHGNGAAQKSRAVKAANGNSSKTDVASKDSHPSKTEAKSTQATT